MSAQLIYEGDHLYARFDSMALLLAYLAHHPEEVETVTLKRPWRVVPSKLEHLKWVCPECGEQNPYATPDEKRPNCLKCNVACVRPYRRVPKWGPGKINQGEEPQGAP